MKIFLRVEYEFQHPGAYILYEQKDISDKAEIYVIFY
jgi:hypothetical protein